MRGEIKKMIKYRYEVSGVDGNTGSLFSGICISDDIIKAIQLFRENRYSVWNIERKEQVHANQEIGIEILNILSGYSAKGKSFQEIFEEVDNSITSDELFRNGEIVEDSGEFDNWYSDAPGGTYNRIRIVKLKEKYYVYREKITINNDSSEKAECTAFYELK